jgi:hypothetical protein
MGRSSMCLSAVLFYIFILFYRKQEQEIPTAPAREILVNYLKCPSAFFFMISYKNIACVKKPDGKIN